MRHLDVIDGIFLRLRPREVDVERELRVSLPHEEEVPHRVASDFVDQLADGDVASRALGQLHLLAALEHRHHLMQGILRVSLRNADVQRLQSRSHARHGAVVVSALHVDRATESARPLRLVIRDIRHEVGVRASLPRALAHDAVLVVAVRRRAEKQRTILLVRPAAGHELPDGLLHATIGVKGRLEKVGVERDTEGLHVEVLLLAKLLHRESPHGIQILARRVPRMLRHVSLGDLGDVRAVIAALGNLQRSAGELAHSRLRAQRQVVDLHAGVVVVELTRHAPARPLEQRRNGVAKRRLPTVAHVQWAGGICADELHDDRLIRTDLLSAILVARGDERGDSTRHRIGAQAKIDEARAGDLSRREPGGRGIERLYQLLREIARLSSEWLGEHHGEIGGPVSECGIAWSLEQWNDVIRRAQTSSGARQLGAQRIGARAHSPELFFGGAGAGLASAGLVSLFGFDSDAGALVVAAAAGAGDSVFDSAFVASPPPSPAGAPLFGSGVPLSRCAFLP